MHSSGCGAGNTIAGNVPPIITSSSDEKLRGESKLADEGVIEKVKYKVHPDVASEMKLTNGCAVYVDINNIGPAFLARDLKAIRRRRTSFAPGSLCWV